MSIASLTPLVCASAMAILGIAFAGEPKLAPDLQELSGLRASGMRVIVQFKTPPLERDHNKIHAKGGHRLASLNQKGAALYQVDSKNLSAIAEDENVDYITPDRPVHPMLDYTAATVGAQIAWQAGLDGTGVGVAIIDSGIYPHDDLQVHGPLNPLLARLVAHGSRIVYTENFNGSEPGDDFGHGTHVAGIIGGNGRDSSGPLFTKTFLGVAPNVNLIDLRVLDAKGLSTDSAVIAAIRRAIELKDRYNIRVINLSLGRPVYETYKKDPLCQAVEDAWRAGIVVVAAAGNFGRAGYQTVTSPGNDPMVITVGAMKTMNTINRSDDLIASYSSKGPSYIDHVVKPDIMAPGNLVVSLASPGSTLSAQLPGNSIPYSYYTKVPVAIRSSKYFRLSGTSMATPVISGAAALMIQKDPSLTPDAVKARLMKTASKTFPTTSTATDPATGAVYVSEYNAFTIGTGYLDLSAALTNSDAATGTAESPAVGYDSASGTVYPVFDPSAIWDTIATWNTSAVWGTCGIWNTNTIVDFSSMEDDTTLQPFSAVWGTSSPVALQTAIEGEL